MRVLRSLLVAVAVQVAAALSVGEPKMIVERGSDGLQDVVSNSTSIG